jgi:hypothetical protein
MNDNLGLNWTKSGFIRKFGPKRFRKIDFRTKVPLVMKEESGIFLFPNLTVRWVATAQEAKAELSNGLK